MPSRKRSGNFTHSFKAFWLEGEEQIPEKYRKYILWELDSRSSFHKIWGKISNTVFGYSKKVSRGKGRVFMRNIFVGGGVLLIGFILLLFVFQTMVNTIDDQILVKEFPDASTVTLYDISQVKFNSLIWEIDPQVYLKGEGFFQIPEGATVNVVTDGGVSIKSEEGASLFLVRDKAKELEVFCSKGTLTLTYHDGELVLEEGEQVHMSFIEEEVDVSLRIWGYVAPNWLVESRTFESVDLIKVLRLIEEQFTIRITASNREMFQHKFSGQLLCNTPRDCLKVISAAYGWKVDKLDDDHFHLTSIER